MHFYFCLRSLPFNAHTSSMESDNETIKNARLSLNRRFLCLNFEINWCDDFFMPMASTILFFTCWRIQWRHESKMRIISKNENTKLVNWWRFVQFMKRKYIVRLQKAIILSTDVKQVYAFCLLLFLLIYTCNVKRNRKQMKNDIIHL